MESCHPSSACHSLLTFIHTFWIPLLFLIFLLSSYFQREFKLFDILPIFLSSLFIHFTSSILPSPLPLLFFMYILFHVFMPFPSHASIFLSSDISILLPSFSTSHFPRPFPHGHPFSYILWSLYLAGGSTRVHPSACGPRRRGSM